MKKTLSIILAILMIVTTTPMAFAADTPVAKIGDIEYTDFKEAVENWIDGTTLTLLEDVDYYEDIKIINKSVIFDLNGKKLNFDPNNYMRFIVGKTDHEWPEGATEPVEIAYPGSLTIRDSKGGGEINGKHAAVQANSSNGIITLESGTLRNFVANSGVFNMTGGDLYGKDCSINSYGEVFITGGFVHNTIIVYDGAVLDISGDAILDSYISVLGDPTIRITGGTGNHNFCDYISEGYKAVDNGDGTWTAVCDHKIKQVYAKAPTCTEIGWDAYEYCTACTYTTYVELPADPDAHTPIEAVKENEVAPKCDVAGSYDLVVYCDDCGAELDRDTKTVDALKHSFTKYEVTEEAKCGVEGKEVACCDNGCGETDEKAIDALTHKDADGDYKCDNGCGYEYEKPEDPTPEEPTPDEPTEDTICTDCGLPAHEETGVAMFICLLIGLFKLIYTFVTSI